jgi:hypothetical protein
MSWARNSKRSMLGRQSAVERADDAERPAVDDMGVDHRRPHVFVAQQRLNRPDIGARLEQVGREAVAERLACRALGKPRRASCAVHGFLYRRFVQVLKNLSTRRRIGARARGGEEVLPREALGRVRHFCAEGMGQVDLPAASCKLRLVPLCHGIELGDQLLARPSRKQRRSIILSFSATDHDLPSIEVDVLDPDRERFEEAKAASIEDLADEAKGWDEVIEQGEGVLPREDRREVFGPAGAFERLESRHFQVEDPFVEEEKRAQRLVLCRRRGSARDCKLIQKGRDLFRTHLPWVLATVEMDELPDPMDVCLFCARRVMQASDSGAYGFDEGHVDGPGCEAAVRRVRTGTYRSGAGASCAGRKIFRPGTSHPWHGVVGTNLAPRCVRRVRGLATGHSVCETPIPTSKGP